MKKRFLSMAIAIILVITVLPLAAFADGVKAEDSLPEVFGSFEDGAEVIRDMIEKNGLNTHPRIIMTEEKFSELRTHIGDGSVTAILLEELRGEADRHIREDAVSEYDAYGDAHLLETSKRVQRRVAALAMAYNIFGDEKYAQRCYEELEAARNFDDWSPKHFLDTAEMCTAFAYGYDWLYNWMDDKQKKDIRDALIEKGLEQVMQDYEDNPKDRKRTYKWYQDQVGDNWQLVCTGGTNLAALAIGDEPEARDIAADVLTYGFKRAYSFVRRSYSETDGTYIEGLGYWDYATYYLGLQSSALISATGTDYGLTDFPGLRKSVDFVRYMSSNTPKSFSFGDDRDSRDTGWAVFLWLGEHFNSPELSAVRLRKIAEDPEFNYLDVLWIDESKQTDSVNNNPTDWGAVGASNASFRNTWDQSGIVAALHAGENYYKYHGHYDLGSFYVEANGARFFTDLGNESYSLENRQFSYRIKAEGHNTLVINPTEDIDQREGADCLITEFSSGNEAYAVTDLTDAYGPSGAKSVIRGLKMIKDKECVIVQDEISLNAAGDIYWFAHTTGQIDIADDGRSAIVTVGSDRLWVGLMSDSGRFTVMNAEPLPTSKNVPNATVNKDYRKLAIHLTNTKDATISVACIPLKNGDNVPSWTPLLQTISDWTAEAAIRYCNVSLSDNIGLNLYAQLSEDTANAEGTGMTFTINDEDISIAVSEAEKVYIDGEELYKFTCPVAAAYMTSDITAQIRVLNDGKLTGIGEVYTCSVRDYADAVINNPGRYGADNVALVKAMLNYGAYAQQYFGINTGNPANKYIYTAADDPVLNFKEIITSRLLTGITTDGELEFYGASLVCTGETALKLYFGSKSGTALTSGQYEVKAVLDGKNRNCSGVVIDNLYVVTLNGITAAELDDIFEFTVIDSKNVSKKVTFTYSPVDYIACAQKTSDIAIVNLTRAMYLYNQAAKVCISGKD